MIVPKLTYNDYDLTTNPTGGPATLAFFYPPTSKPGFNQKATRSDTFSTSGVRQTVVQRVNSAIPIQMSNILAGADAAAWARFLAWAVQGGSFLYYPDATNLVQSAQYFLVESDAMLTYSSPGIYSFKGTFQLEILPS